MASEALVLARFPVSEAAASPPYAMREPDRTRLDLGGVLVDRLDLPGAIERLGQMLDSEQAHQIVTVNLDFVSIARRNADFQETLNTADLAVADGMPLVWASRLTGNPLPHRITGVDLVAESCRLAAERGRGVFLLGARPGVAEAAARTLQAQYPGLNVVGTYSPPHGALTRAEDEHIVRLIREARPGVLLVALGAPRQDLWIRDHLDTLGVPISMGVGCVFDLLAGQVSRAPVWMQRVGLEWAFRLGQEPGRLWRRYLLDDLPIVAHIFLSARAAPARAATAAT